MKILQLLFVFGALLFCACATRNEKPTLAEFIQSVQAGAARTTANNQSAPAASIQREKRHSTDWQGPDYGSQAGPSVVPTINSSRPWTRQQVGNISFDSNGGITQRIGNTYFHSDGTSTQKVGNTYFNSGGGTTQKIGNTYFHSGGGTTQQIGNTYLHSDGSTSQRIGNVIIND